MIQFFSILLFEITEQILLRRLHFNEGGGGAAAPGGRGAQAAAITGRQGHCLALKRPGLDFSVIYTVFQNQCKL
jgi:hypothetical protein